MKRKIIENPFGKANAWQERIYKELHEIIKQNHSIRPHYHKLWIRKKADQRE